MSVFFPSYLQTFRLFYFVGVDSSSPRTKGPASGSGDLGSGAYKGNNPSNTLKLTQREQLKPRPANIAIFGHPTIALYREEAESMLCGSTWYALGTRIVLGEVTMDNRAACIPQRIVNLAGTIML